VYDDDERRAPFWSYARFARAFEWNCAERYSRGIDRSTSPAAAVRTRISPLVLGADPLRMDVNYGKPGTAPVGLPCR